MKVLVEVIEIFILAVYLQFQNNTTEIDDEKHKKQQNLKKQQQLQGRAAVLRAH